MGLDCVSIRQDRSSRTTIWVLLVAHYYSVEVIHL
jgi:hypothetical protein